MNKQGIQSIAVGIYDEGVPPGQRLRILLRARRSGSIFVVNSIEILDVFDERTELEMFGGWEDLCLKWCVYETLGLRKQVRVPKGYTFRSDPRGNLVSDLRDLVRDNRRINYTSREDNDHLYFIPN